jgi:hypothetical protein
MMKYWAPLVVLGLAQALDVEVTGTKCDESLPLTADVKLKCDAGARCTFGQDATVYGDCKSRVSFQLSPLRSSWRDAEISQLSLFLFIVVYYNGVANSGVENDVAYLTANLALWTLDFNLFDMMQIPLCSSTLVADANNQNACPGDGTQAFEIPYSLPSAGSNATSWLASGWESSGIIQIFAQQDETMKIGECVLSLKTYVTRSSSEKSLISTPSAAASVGIALAVAAVLAMLGLYCYCCMKKRKNKSKIQTTGDTDESYFKRLEDEKSYWSGSGSKKSSATKKTGEHESVVSELP